MNQTTIPKCSKINFSKAQQVLHLLKGGGGEIWFNLRPSQHGEFYNSWQKLKNQGEDHIWPRTYDALDQKLCRQQSVKGFVAAQNAEDERLSTEL